MLKIKNLKGGLKDLEILKGINLEFEAGKTYAIMGRNGSGKSTLLSIIMGSEIYQADGSITHNGEQVLGIGAENIAKRGIFLSFQSPLEFDEITTIDYLKMLWEKTEGLEGQSDDDFIKANKDLLDSLDITEKMLKRNLNVGFSGGERKRVEVLQLLLIKPKVVLLDEIDTGLDVDSVLSIAKTIAKYQEETDATIIIVTHLSTFLKHVVPDGVHVIEGGLVAKSGDASLAEKITNEGYKSIL